MLPAIISVRAVCVIDNKNGTYTLQINDASALSNDDRLTLERLFPNLVDSAYNLLNQEALLASIATPAEVDRKPEDTVKGRKAKYATCPPADAYPPDESIGKATTY